MKKKEKALVGMSGGVDSSVAAFLLKEEGYEVKGVFMKVWDEEDAFTGPVCYSSDNKDILDAKKISEILDIDLIILDVSKEYKRIVLEYFKKEYLNGKTPNPCIICNRFLKFGFLIQKIIQQNIKFDFFATGHYSIVEYSYLKKIYELKKGCDTKKDQSYFLFLLTQKQLSQLIFPLGNYTKKDVNKIALKQGFPITEKKESQDFISNNRTLIFTENIKQGDIVDTKGNTIGEHKGIIYYTIGQRKGIGVSASNPLYVIDIDAENNEIVVGEESSLYKKGCIVSGIHLINGGKMTLPLKCEVKIRYKHTAAEAVVIPIKEDKIKVIFDTSQRAITPGQAAVFYQGDTLLGGGFIEKIL